MKFINLLSASVIASMTFPIDQAKRLPPAFYQNHTANVAQDLIGKAIAHRVRQTWVGGVIVETEAYLHSGDPASHSARGKTASNASMFDRPGVMYVYPIHAKHCLNAVTEDTGIGAAVLIRAIEPLWGLEMMCERRGLMGELRGHTERRRLTTGPAMLCQALGIDRRDDGRCFVTDPDLGFFDLGPPQKRRIVATPRIGISKAQHRKLRFIDADSKFLSRPYRD
ncbi:DNA-3-methyladenine glycosylase [Rhodopirellula sp. MGV]|uniref:DNA-3-methyladenine glycosylase n=1 Tax=Rhodopirellula sp. MGV TaxID=2023130 RepID=UPI0013041C2E|nr:DNA-3-methyladenine glycosylase [Rhodopirellula sp. MGV]